MIDTEIPSLAFPSQPQLPYPDTSAKKHFFPARFGLEEEEEDSPEKVPLEAMAKHGAFQRSSLLVHEPPRMSGQGTSAPTEAQQGIIFHSASPRRFAMGREFHSAGNLFGSPAASLALKGPDSVRHLNSPLNFHLQDLNPASLVHSNQDFETEAQQLVNGRAAGVWGALNLDVFSPPGPRRQSPWEEVSEENSVFNRQCPDLQAQALSRDSTLHGPGISTWREVGQAVTAGRDWIWDEHPVDTSSSGMLAPDQQQQQWQQEQGKDTLAQSCTAGAHVSLGLLGYLNSGPSYLPVFSDRLVVAQEVAKAGKDSSGLTFGHTTSALSSLSGSEAGRNDSELNLVSSFHEAQQDVICGRRGECTWSPGPVPSPTLSLSDRLAAAVDRLEGPKWRSQPAVNIEPNKVLKLVHHGCHAPQEELLLQPITSKNDPAFERAAASLCQAIAARESSIHQLPDLLEADARKTAVKKRKQARALVATPSIVFPQFSGGFSNLGPQVSEHMQPLGLGRLQKEQLSNSVGSAPAHAHKGRLLTEQGGFVGGAAITRALALEKSAPEMSAGDEGAKRAMFQRLQLLAQALDQKNASLFEDMYGHLKTFARSRGKALDRTVNMMLHAMLLRLEGSGFISIGTPYKRSVKEITDAKQWYYLGAPVCPYAAVATKSILYPKVIGKPFVHVIEVGEAMIPQWPSVMKELVQAGKVLDQQQGAEGLTAGKRRSPTGSMLRRLRITHLNYNPLIHPGKTSLEQSKSLPRYVGMLEGAAKSLGIDFEYSEIRLDEVGVKKLDRLQAFPEETVVGCVSHCLKTMHDTDNEGNGVLDKFLQCMHRIKPEVLVVTEETVEASCESFVPRCMAYADFFHTLLDSHDALVEGGRKKLVHAFEQNYLGVSARSVVACEGVDRRVRPHSGVLWKAKLEEKGFVCEPFHQHFFEAETSMLKGYPKGFSVQESGGLAYMMWKGRPLQFCVSLVQS